MQRNVESDDFSVKTALIIPPFTRFWDDARKEQRGESWHRSKAWLIFLSVLLPFQILARFHDEATTSDYGSDIGDQFNIVTSADEHRGNDA
jgi:hypothetical protein